MSSAAVVIGAFGLINARFVVLQQCKHGLDFILQRDSRTAFSSLAKMSCKEIFSQPDLRKTAQNLKIHDKKATSTRASSKCLLIGVLHSWHICFNITLLAGPRSAVGRAPDL